MTESTPGAPQRSQGIVPIDDRHEFAQIFRSLINAWYGDYWLAGKALGVNPGTMYRYCTGEARVPNALLCRLLDRQGRDLRARLAEVRARVERARIKAEERERIILAADAAGVAAIKARLERKDPTLVWTHLGYKPVDKVKPHPRRIRQKASED